MKKNPAECKNIMRFGDIYICKLQTVPCAALEKCALETVDNLVKVTQALIQSMDQLDKEDGKDDSRAKS